MPRITSLMNRPKKSPIFYKIFSGTDFSSYHSTWTFSTGTISLQSSTLPYHSYGNSDASTTATNQGCNRSWPLRAGTNPSSDLFVNITGISTGNFLTTTTSLLSQNMPIVFDTTVSSILAGEQYFIRSISSSSFRVSLMPGEAPLTLTSITTLTGSVSIASSGTGNIGYWINGVNMYNPSAAKDAPNGYLTFSNLNYNAAYETVKNYSYYLEQDNAGGRTTSNGNYHYHNFSFEDAWTTGTAHVGTGTKVVATGTAEISLISYLSGGLQHNDGHSKILGWSLDGYPVYGPYGYNLPLDSNSGIRSMVSSYSVYTNVQDIPARVTDGVLNTFEYPLGIFIQDFYYTGGGDLDVYNGRYCVTPEYPQGTYAYFCTKDPDTGLPAYPYIIGNWHKSEPVQGSQTSSNLTNGDGFAPKQTG